MFFAILLASGCVSVKRYQAKLEAWNTPGQISTRCEPQLQPWQFEQMQRQLLLTEFKIILAELERDVMKEQRLFGRADMSYSYVFWRAGWKLDELARRIYPRQYHPSIDDLIIHVPSVDEKILIDPPPVENDDGPIDELDRLLLEESKD